MGFRYHIDGTQEFGYSPINRFEYSFHMYMNLVKRVCDLHQFASVQYLKGYVAHFCYLRLKSFDTFIKVAVEHKDYVSANCLLRMLGDSVAIFRLIYRESDKDLMLLRHALYVIDGCKRNLDVLPENNMNKGSMPDDELAEVNKQILFNREHRKRMMSDAQEILDQSPLQAKDKAAFDKIVKDRNWKFKEFKDYKKIASNQYKWKELYDKIGCCKHIDLLSYISQYTHGLSMSNLVMQLDESNLHGIVAEGVGLLDRLYIYALEFFVEEKQYILEGLLNPETSEKIRAYFDEQHRPDAATWNQRVINKIREAIIEAPLQYC